MKKAALGIITQLLFLTPVIADTVDSRWMNRPNVIRAGQRLAAEVEAFDEALHDVSAPLHVTQKVHHFEETVGEFVMLAQTGTYQQAYQEFNHIRADFQIIRQEMMSHPQLLQNYKVAQEFQHMRTAYRSVDHEMFVRDTNRWPKQKVDQLERDLEQLELDHK